MLWLSPTSVVAVTDKDGNITDTLKYDAYGSVIERTGDSKLIFTYNGQYGVLTDPNGLLYMRTRFYNSQLKRFMNADILDGDIADSTTLNLYAYVNGNPISYVDPFGMSVDTGRGDNTSGSQDAWCGVAYLEKTSVTTIDEEIDLTFGFNVIRLAHTQTVTTTKTHGTEGKLFGAYAYSDLNVNGSSVGVGLDILYILGYETSLEMIGRGETISINYPDGSVYMNVAFNILDDATVSFGGVRKLENGDEINDQYSIKGNIMEIAVVVASAKAGMNIAPFLKKILPQFNPQPQS